MNIILTELEQRAQARVNSLTAKLYSLACALMEVGAEHQKRVVQVMPEFDLHDGTHLAKVLDNIADLIGEKRAKGLSDVELFMLITASYLHDCGMAPSEWELKLMSLTEGYKGYKTEEKSICHDGLTPFSFTEAAQFIESHKADIYGKYDDNLHDWIFSEKSEGTLMESLALTLTDYQNYRNGYVSELGGCTSLSDFKKMNDSIRVNYIRERHPQCASRYITNAKTKFLAIIDEPWANKLAQDLAKICQAHGEDLNYVKSLSVSERYCPDEDVNLQFVAMMLRLGDICHYSSDRAPLAIRNAKRFQSFYSYMEWAVKAASVKYEIKGDRIAYYAYCDNPEKYYKLQGYIDWIDSEINNFCNLQRNWDGKYQSTILDVDRSGISYDESSFRPVVGKQFSLHQNKIIQLLMGVGLYKDPFASLRELYQNSMDACKCEYWKKKAQGQEFNGVIEFGLHKCEYGTYLYCSDNGTGMSEDIIEKYLLKIGNSYYKSSDFYREQATWGSDFVPTSQFGIGILSCFMIATKIEIITKTENQKEPVACCIDGPQEFFYYRNPSKVEAESIPASGTMVRLLLKDEYSDVLNDKPIDKLGLVMQYERTNIFSGEFEAYNGLYDDWKGSLYNKVNGFISKTPENIEIFCRFDDGSLISIVDKPFALKVGDWGIKDEDRDFINTLISRRMFSLDSLSLVDAQDYLVHYPISVSEKGIEYRTLIPMPLPGMPATDDDTHLLRLLQVSGSDVSVDGIAVKDKNSRIENTYFELLSRNGEIDFTGSYKPQLSVDRQEIINFHDGDEGIYREIAIEGIQKVLEVVIRHVEKYNLSSDTNLVNLIWKYVFDRIYVADVLFVNYLAESQLGEFRWPALTAILKKDITIADFMKSEVVDIEGYDFARLDLLARKLVLSKFFAADNICINGHSDVRIHCDKTTGIPENDGRFHNETYLVPVANDFDCFKEYDIVENLYPLVPERLVKGLKRYSGVDYEIKNSRAISVHTYGNNFTAFFTQDARLVHPKHGLYTMNSSFGRRPDCYINTFENKRADIQFMDFGYDAVEYHQKKWMMMLAYVAPQDLTERDKMKIEEFKSSDMEYHQGVMEGWTILITGMKIDNVVILSGMRNRKEAISHLSAEFWKEYEDFEFCFLDGMIVKNGEIV